MARLLIFTLFITSILLTPMLTNAQENTPDKAFHLLVGTYTSGKSEGIYVYRFDAETGKLKLEFIAKGIKNPSFVTASPDGNFVYAVKEVSGDKEGMVNAFRFHKQSGELEFINQQPSGGGDPCYLTINKNTQHLFVGNYTGGNLSVIPILEDGSLGAPVQTIQHEGQSVNKNRQEKAHVHSTVLGPQEDYLFVGDLGVDKIFSYQYNPKDKNAPLKAATEPYTPIAPGTGPRHLVFNENGNHAYLIQELTAEVSVFGHKKGGLKHLQTVGLTDKGFEGEISAAEIKLSPDGKFLYASNRGDANEISVFKINQQKGTLSHVSRHSSMGLTPRNFTIDPTGSYLLVANQNSDSIVIFKRDKKTGKLTQTGQPVEVGNPVYLKMLRIK